jgi:recombination protein RecT
MSETAVAPRPSVDVLMQAIERERPRLQAYLPDGLSIDRFVALLDRQVRNNPRLAECSTNNVLREVSAAAASGLPIDGQFSTLLVRDNTKTGRPSCRWDPTYRGLIALALASNFVVDVQSGVVRSNDHFEFNEGSAPSLVHRRCLLPKWGDVIASWATAKLSTGGLVIEILTAGDIAKIKAMSPAGERGPWGAWADQMARKSAIRRLLRRLPAGTVRLSAPLEITAAPDQPARIVAPIAEQPPGGGRALSPDEENALECTALERLHDAGTPAALEVAWAASLAAYQQRGAAVPLRVEATHRELAESFAEEGA